MTDLRYPIGDFTWNGSTDAASRAERIDQIAAVPAAMRKAVAGLSPAQMETPYRPGGWTVRQVVHHLSDSHLNGYVRFKLTLTEDQPVIKPYIESRWAELADGATKPETSLTLLDALHERWVTLLRAMTPEQFARAYHHPEYNRLWKLDEVLALYAWHGRHHVAHITSLREREGW